MHFNLSQLAFTYSKLAIKTIERGVKYTTLHRHSHQQASTRSKSKVKS